MKYQVRLTEKAEQDVALVLQWFLEQDAVAEGGKWFARLMTAIAKLETMPQRCGLAAEAADIGLEIRELLCGKRIGAYRLLFQIEGRTVYVLRVWHSSRDAVSRDDV